MSAEVAADLRAAAEVLRRDGWRNDGEAYTSDCPNRCAAQAIWLVCTGGDEAGSGSDQRYSAAFDALDDLLGERCSVFRWNDDVAADADEVIAALEAAADAADRAE